MRSGGPDFSSLDCYCLLVRTIAYHTHRPAHTAPTECAPLIVSGDSTTVYAPPPTSPVSLCPHPSPGWGSCSVLLLHWVKPTIATILAPRLLRRFLAVVLPAPPPACWDPQISPLMLELLTTFLEAPAEAGPGSPLNMVPRMAGLQAILKVGERKRDSTLDLVTLLQPYCLLAVEVWIITWPP